MIKLDYQKLKEFANSDRQIAILDALSKTSSQGEAARLLGINKRNVERALQSIRARAAIGGYSPEHKLTTPLPSPFFIERMSQKYDADGNLKEQWIKSKADSKKIESVITDFVNSLVDDVRGISPIISSPSFSNSDLLCVYPMGDPHFGMYAWAEECGEDFDLNKAELLTKSAINRLIESSPDSETAILLSLGDFFHADNQLSRTERSGNVLDVDTRWTKVMQIGLKTLVYCIISLLKKHKTVIVRFVRGNHDPHSSYAIALAISAYFENEKRVTVELSPNNFWFYKFGKTLIGATHGHTCKMEHLPGIMATDRPKDWGDTEFRYWYLGHVHHQNVKEFPGVICETFRTLASRDAWHSESGYRAGRDMYCIVHHKNHGEIERHRCDISMIQRSLHD